MQPFTFYLDFYLSGQFAGLCWAQEKGLYAQAGLAVDLCSRGGRSILDEVADGALCAGSSEDNCLITANIAGRSFRALGAMLQETPLVLMTRPTSGIQTLADLPGRRVGMHVDGIRILEAVLELEGVDRSTIEITQVDFDLDNLARDRFDAVQGYAMAEPIELAAMGVDVHLIPIRHAELHPYAQVFFATEACIARAPEVFRRFLQASFEGWRRAMADRDEAARVVMALAQDYGTLTTERQVIEAMQPYVAGDVGLQRFGNLDPARWARNLASYARFGITPRQLTLKETVDDQFLKAIYED